MDIWPWFAGENDQKNTPKWKPYLGRVISNEQVNSFFRLGNLNEHMWIMANVSERKWLLGNYEKPPNYMISKLYQ